MEQHPDSPAVRTATAASLEASLDPAPAADNPLAPHTEPEPQPSHLPVPAPDDEPGFDPSAYKWVPVLRKPRADGWTPQRQVAFISALADTACVEQAARRAGMSVMSCYRLRRAPGAEAFAQAWDIALQHGAKRLLDIAFDRAIHGSDEPVFDKEGRRVGRRMRQNDRLLMFLLRAYMPERFRHANSDGRSAGEPPLPPPPAPLGEALERLEPPAPPEPHRLMPPEDLEVALQCADLLDGELPHWHRGRGDGDPGERVDPVSPFGEAFERLLEEAKNGGSASHVVSGDEEREEEQGPGGAFQA